MTQHKAAARDRSMSYITTLHCLVTGHENEAQIIGRAHIKVGRLVIDTVHSDESSINRFITLDHCCALIKDRLTL